MRRAASSRSSTNSTTATSISSCRRRRRPRSCIVASGCGSCSRAPRAGSSRCKARRTSPASTGRETARAARELACYSHWVGLLQRPPAHAVFSPAKATPFAGGSGRSRRLGPLQGPQDLAANQLEYAAPDLVLLDGFEQGAEVALAEALVAFPLNDLEEDRTDDVLREDLRQQALALLGIAIDQDAARAQLSQGFPMAGHALGELLIIGIGRVLERNPVSSQHVHRAVDVPGGEGNVLDAFAVILAQVFLDLALVVLRLVDRDADLAARTGHGARQEPGVLTLDVEVADLAEVEQLLVEAGPYIHAPAADVVRQMVDQGESCCFGRRASCRAACHGAKIHVIDRAFAVQVDQVDE